jgi:chemotaxis protein histidine kinase CheA
MNDEFAQLLSLFRAESQDILDELAQALGPMANEQAAPSEDEIKHCMRLAHNVKGAAAVVDWQSLVRLSHAAEDIIRSLAIVDPLARSSRIELLLEALTFMQRHAAEGSPEPVDAPPQAVFLQERLRFELLKRGTPSPASPAPSDRTEPVQTMTPQDPTQAGAPSTKGEASSVSSLRVETQRIDQLMSFTSELLLAHGRAVALESRLTALLEELRSVSGGFAHATSVDLDLSIEHLAALARDHRRDRVDFGYLAEGLSEAIRKVRMVRIESYGHAFRRAVREAALVLDKQAELSLDVGDMELDKAVLERLVEPLVHLLRNAVGHGIETPGLRSRLGKPVVGRLRLSARAEGSSMLLILEDDGQGIDVAKIRGAIVERGLASSAEALSMNDQEVLEHLTRSGFSTATEVTSVSGRGVGLDIVAGALGALGGYLRIHPKGRLGGAAFHLTAPLSLLTTHVLLVRDKERMLALPLEAVTRTLRTDLGAAPLRDGFKVALDVDGGPLPLRSPGSLFQAEPMPERGSKQVVVLERSGKRLGLVVDEILRHEELVVQKLPLHLDGLETAAGAIALPDGSLCLLLRVSQLLAAAESGAQPMTRPAERRPRVLVVDDSLTARTLARNILTGAGYDVAVASDGEEAWDKLCAGSFELVVSDVQMPRLDGLSLTQRIRAHEATARIPVILISTLASTEEIAAGMAAGADDYVVKGAYEQEKLIQAATRYL